MTSLLLRPTASGRAAGRRAARPARPRRGGRARSTALGRRDPLGPLDQRADRRTRAGRRPTPSRTRRPRAATSGRPGRPGGGDRRAPGRHLVDHRRSRSPKTHHRRGARDRRRGHDEQVRVGGVGRVVPALVAQRGALLDAEAVLLVDDDDAQGGEIARRRSSSAWVPTTMSTSPRARRVEHVAALARAQPPGDLLDDERPRPAEHARRRRREGRPGRARSDATCCSARTSVGAISAPWRPPSTATSSVAVATSVLPDPTSPCKSRCIGSGEARSAAISPSTRRWAPVSEWRWPDEEARERATTTRSRPPAPTSRSAGSTAWAIPADAPSTRRRRSASSSCRRRTRRRRGAGARRPCRPARPAGGSPSTRRCGRRVRVSRAHVGGERVEPGGRRAQRLVDEAADLPAGEPGRPDAG